MISIDHGDLVYSLMLTTESLGILYTTKKAGGKTVSEATILMK
ncbi:hypothetical protein Lser_V15G39415 [Lactuca serriola]